MIDQGLFFEDVVVVFDVVYEQIKWVDVEIVYYWQCVMDFDRIWLI